MTLNFRNSLVAGALALCSLTAQAAGEGRMLSLPEAIRLGIQNSSKLALDSARLIQAQVQYETAKEAALPEASVSAQQLFLNQPTVNLKVPLQQGSGGGSDTAAKTGSVEVNRAFMANASISMPLYAGGKIRYGKESARLLREAARLATQNDRASVAYTVTQAYNNVYKASQAMAVIEENLRSARQRDSTFSRLEDNGVIPRNDRLKAALQTSNTELQLLEAESNYAIAKSTLALLVGLPENTALEVNKAYATIQIPDGSYEAYLQQAIDNRADLKALGYQREAALVGIKSAKAGYLPTIAATAGYFYVDVPNFLNVSNALNGGLALKYNLSSIWKTKNAIHQAQAQQLEVEANRSNLTDAIRLQINQDYQSQQLAQRKISVYQKAQQQAEENARIVKNKYDNGLATVTDLLEADAALLNTKLNVSYAQSDAALAYYRLLQTTGVVPVETTSN
ncbi:MAG: TolC family protein [Sphingobacteriales bacterium]|nr:MAG: TolC family protein [Sphingobacteriales bacterium]